MEHVIRPPSAADTPLLQVGTLVSVAAPLSPVARVTDEAVAAIDGAWLTLSGNPGGVWEHGEPAIILVKQDAGRFACHATFVEGAPGVAVFQTQAWRRIEARREARNEALLAARIESESGESVPGVIVDVSAGGMRLLCSRAVAAASLQVHTIVPADGPFRCRLVALRAFGEGYAVHLEVDPRDRAAWNRVLAGIPPAAPPR